MKLIEAEKAKDVIHEYFKSLMAKDASGTDVYKLAVSIGSCLKHDANLLKAIDELPSAEPDTTTHDSIPAETGKNDGDGTSGDCISRQAAIDAICTEGTRLERNGTVAMVEIKQWCVGILEALPPAQPDIIRCKDCKHRDPEDKKCDCGHDIQWQLPRQDNWYCADAERREVME